MSRVGSFSVYYTLRAARLPNQLYHAHYLSPRAVRSGSFHDRRSYSQEMLIGVLRRGLPGIRWKVITIVREPLAREVSSFFHFLHSQHPDLLARGQPRVEAAVARLTAELEEFDESRNTTCNWLESELGPTLGIDVYREPFNPAAGYRILRSGAFDLLILRCEDLDRVFSDAVRVFLELGQRLPLRRSNVNLSGWYRAALEGLALPRDVCERVYASRYARHFYSEVERAAFIRRWSSG